MPQQEPDDLPTPTAPSLAVLVRVAIESHIATAHLKAKLRAPAFIDVMAQALRHEAQLGLVSPIRAPEGHAEATRAAREALAMFEAYRPVFLARIPRDMD